MSLRPPKIPLEFFNYAFLCISISFSNSKPNRTVQRFKCKAMTSKYLHRQINRPTVVRNTMGTQKWARKKLKRKEKINLNEMRKIFCFSNSIYLLIFLSLALDRNENKIIFIFSQLQSPPKHTDRNMYRRAGSKA